MTDSPDDARRAPHGRPIASTPLLPFALVLLLGGGSGIAAEPRLLFSGFGTLGYAVLDDPDAEYRTGRAADGADGKGSFEVDSRLGLQLDVEATERLSGTIQGVAREGDDGDPEAQLEWAFLRWLPSDSVTLRLGRLALPVYALSDYREVGYANTLLRPPEEVYSQVPIRSFDGADASAYAELGETLLSAQLFAGQYGTRLPTYTGIDLEARDILGANIVVERGAVRLRLSRTVTRIALDSDGLRQIRDGIARARAFAPELAELAELEREFSSGYKNASFSAIGLSLDFERVFLDAEYTRRRIDSWAPDIDGWYASVGTRIGTLTPYVFAAATDGIERRRGGPDLPDLASLASLEAGLNAVSGNKDQSSAGLGLRWDFAPRAAVKLQVERVASEAGGVGISLDRTSNPSAPDSAGDGDDVVLTSVVVDFVF